MPLTKISIHGYRGFREVGNLNFAEPNGRDGSGLTVITGPNNSGKSCILECLRTRSGGDSVSFTSGTRNSLVDLVTINFLVNGKEESIRSVARGSSETQRVGVDQSLKVFVLPSRRAFNPYFSKSEYSRDVYIQNNPLPAQRSSVLGMFEFRLFATLKNPGPFNEILAEALGYKPNWTIDQSDQGQYFLKFFNGEHSHSSDGMGEGIVSIFSIVDALYDSKPGDVIVIDEPELSLHPSLQRRIASLLMKFARDRQIIISTHSPYFVDLHALQNGGHLARVVSGNGGTRIHELTPNSRAAVIKLGSGNLYNPHVFGLDARELFFQDNGIVLTEGQEDVLLYPRVAEQLALSIPGHFFGWGAGGASNIAHLCLILSDLGFSKVAGLLDGDKVKEAEDLRQKYPKFHFDCIPAKDIRTKPARAPVGAVVGLLDDRLQLRPEHADAMRRLLVSLSAHMNA